MKTVYLYGPIGGLTFDDAQSWRTWMRKELAPYGIDAVSPLRFKEYLSGVGELSGHGREYADRGVMATPPAVLARDKFDVLRADMLLGNFLGAQKPSIGSMFEQAWAHLRHIPVAAAVDLGHDHPHDHMFFDQTIDFRVHTLEGLRDVAIAILVGESLRT